MGADFIDGHAKAFMKHENEQIYKTTVPLTFGQWIEIMMEHRWANGNGRINIICPCQMFIVLCVTQQVEHNRRRVERMGF